MNLTNEAANRVAHYNGILETAMRGLCSLLTFTFVLCGVSVAGTTDRLPNAGLFSYCGSKAISTAPVLLAMDHR